MNDTPVVVGLAPLALVPVPIDPDAELEAATLPADHPRWQPDVLSISARARAAIANLAPLVVRVFTYWDHRVREIAFGHRRLAVDPAGSYRLR
jgi:hypothetical protein